MDEYEQTYSAEGDSGVEMKTRKRWLYISLLIVIILVSGVVFLSNSYSEPIKILRITVNGNNIVSKNEIIKSIDISKVDKKNNRNFLSELKKQVEKNPYVNFSYIYQKNSSEIIVEISEKFPSAILIDENNNNYFVASDGSILPYKLINTKYDFPIIRGVGIPEKNYSSVINSALELISCITCDENTELSKAISEIVYNTIDKNFKIILSESGKEILIGNPSKKENKSKKLLVLLKNLVCEQDLAEAESIDLRWKNQIIVKSKSDFSVIADSIKKKI